MKLSLPVYLDNNATTPCDPRVVEVMLPYFTTFFGNAASRTHVFGWQAEEAVELARGQVATLVGADPKEIVFTSGATEGDNLALKGVFERYSSKGNHIITVKTEHKAVLDTCAQLEKIGAEITILEVNEDGLIDLHQLESAIRPATVLIAVMYANNETGVIQPVKEIGAIAKKHDVLFFSDGVQAAGKIPVNVQDDNIDIMALSAHKMYGPKGVGAVYVRRRNPRVRLAAQVHGGGHEQQMRSGTLNVPAIVGFGKACELAAGEMERDALHTGNLRDKLETALLELEETYVNGDRNKRLPNVTSLAFRHAGGEALMMSLNKQVALSAGSACTSGSIEPSHVLKALGLEDDLAHSSLRFGVGRFTTEAEIDFVIEKVKTGVEMLRKTSPQWAMFKAGITI